eukprot:m.160603 g.160603  ORF g.160603 m.160603 type:complete len:221 (+) comp38775_c1_seq33:293-955(+)
MEKDSCRTVIRWPKASLLLMKIRMSNWWVFSEKNQVTVLQFKRKVQACDKKDRSIEISTSQVIWAYHQEDPESPDDLKMHQKMGSRSVNLLIGNFGEDVSLPADVQYFDVITDKVSIPANETTYWCKSFTLPKIPSGADIVAVGPLFRQCPVHFTLISRLNPSFKGTTRALCITSLCTGATTYPGSIWNMTDHAMAICPMRYPSVTGQFHWEDGQLEEGN